MPKPPDKVPSMAVLSGWLQAAKAGELQAMSQLLEAYRPMLLKIANDELSPELRQKIPASDLVQNSLIKATLGFPQSEFRGPQDVVAWLQTILANEMATAFRRYGKSQKRDLKREQPFDSAQFRTWIDAVSVIQSRREVGRLSRQEELEEIRRVVERLPAHYRQVILWRLLEELTFPAIAKLVDRSESAVRLLFGRAMDMLKQELDTIRPS